MQTTNCQTGLKKSNTTKRPRTYLIALYEVTGGGKCFLNARVCSNFTPKQCILCRESVALSRQERWRFTIAKVRYSYKHKQIGYKIHFRNYRTCDIQRVYKHIYV